MRAVVDRTRGIQLHRIDLTVNIPAPFVFFSNDDPFSNYDILLPSELRRPLISQRYHRSHHLATLSTT